MSQNINFFPRTPPSANPGSRICSSRRVGPIAGDHHVKVLSFLCHSAAREIHAFQSCSIKLSARGAATPQCSSKWKQTSGCLLCIDFTVTYSALWVWELWLIALYFHDMHTKTHNPATRFKYARFHAAHDRTTLICSNNISPVFN